MSSGERQEKKILRNANHGYRVKTSMPLDIAMYV
jgi:hypothetical protein